MLKELRDLLAHAERLPGWSSNSREPWLPMIRLLSDRLEVPVADIHAAKIQKSSPRKSLWQGRLHRGPVPPVLLLASDRCCDDKSFDALSRAVEERFLPPTPWADACIVVSDKKVIGCVEREGVNLAEWLSLGRQDIKRAICSPIASQIDVLRSLSGELSPIQFLSELESGLQKGAPSSDLKRYIAPVFGLSNSEIIVSIAASSANAAKNRWEGADMDPSIRYRLALVAANEWDWAMAAPEIISRMDPSDLSLDVALLSAKAQEEGPWERFRAFVRKGGRADRIRIALEAGEIADVRVLSVDTEESALYEVRRTRSTRLRVRDSDAGDISYEVSRPKRRVHDFLTNLLHEWAEQHDFELLEGADDASMYDALVRMNDRPDLLIEVKTSADPGVVRLAVGQLIDYRRVLQRDGQIGGCECVLMLPAATKPTTEMEALLAEVGFSWAVLRKMGAELGEDLILEIRKPDGSIQRIP